MHRPGYLCYNREVSADNTNYNGHGGRRARAGRPPELKAQIAEAKSLAKELSNRNICVNAVSPGIVYTKQHEKFSSKEYYNSLIKKVPLGRDGKTSDISNLVKFLCSDECSYITGQVIEINGGMLMR